MNTQTTEKTGSKKISGTKSALNAISSVYEIGLTEESLTTIKKALGYEDLVMVQTRVPAKHANAEGHAVGTARHYVCYFEQAKAEGWTAEGHDRSGYFRFLLTTATQSLERLLEQLERKQAQTPVQNTPVQRPQKLPPLVQPEHITLFIERGADMQNENVSEAWRLLNSCEYCYRTRCVPHTENYTNDQWTSVMLSIRDVTFRAYALMSVADPSSAADNFMVYLGTERPNLSQPLTIKVVKAALKSVHPDNHDGWIQQYRILVRRALTGVNLGEPADKIVDELVIIRAARMAAQPGVNVNESLRMANDELSGIKRRLEQPTNPDGNTQQGPKGPQQGGFKGPQYGTAQKPTATKAADATTPVTTAKPTSLEEVIAKQKAQKATTDSKVDTKAVQKYLAMARVLCKDCKDVDGFAAIVENQVRIFTADTKNGPETVTDFTKQVTALAASFEASLRKEIADKAANIAAQQAKAASDKAKATDLTVGAQTKAAEPKKDDGKPKKKGKKNGRDNGQSANA